MNDLAQRATPANEYRFHEKVHSRESQIAFQRAILQALQLPRPYWEVFVLCDIQAHKLQEAAKILGITTDLAIKRLQRARRLMESFPVSTTA